MEEVVNRAIKAAGGLYKLAALLGVSPQAVVNWRSRGVPLNKCAQVEAVTGGAVTRTELRHDAHLIWPELRPAAMTAKRKTKQAA